MTIINPRMLKLLGSGFLSDEHVADGIHLRWIFNPQLGFPRKAFCIFRRPSVDTEIGRREVRPFFDRFDLGQAQTHQTLVRNEFSIDTQSGTFSTGPNGIPITSIPITIDVHGGALPNAKPSVCWVELRTKILVTGGNIDAQGIWTNKSGEVLVAQERRGDHAMLSTNEGNHNKAMMQRLRPVLDLLAAPETGAFIPRLTRGPLSDVYSTLVRIDHTRYAFVTPAYLQRLVEKMQFADVDAEDIVSANGIFASETIILRADIIDEIKLQGESAFLQSIRAVRVENLLNARDWESVECVPIATDDPEYRARNSSAFSGIPTPNLTEKRILEPLVPSVEPLDEAVIPPVSPVSQQRRMERYGEPWLSHFEPWIQRVLSESSTLSLHQLEILEESPLTDAGQVPGDGVPDQFESAGGTNQRVNLYPTLLAISAAFPVARLLGLGAVDMPENRNAGDIWDYQVIGTWDMNDLDQIVLMIKRRLDRISSVTPENAEEQKSKLELLAALSSELATAETLVKNFSTESDDNQVEIAAFKLGLDLKTRARFQSSSKVTASFDGFSSSEASPGSPIVVNVDWLTRRRAQVTEDEHIPLGAVIARSLKDTPGEFEEVINPKHPITEMNALVLPAIEKDISQTEAVARFVDRTAKEGSEYRYGVSEVDPFGRWSEFRETKFLYDYDVPPPEPRILGAQLTQSDGSSPLSLTLQFTWDADSYPLSEHGFQVHLRREAPDSASPHDRSQWGHFGRESDVGPPFEFPGTALGLMSFGGMTVSIEVTDESVPDPLSDQPRQMKRFEVTFTGLEITRDAIDRARVWAGVSSNNFATNLVSDGVSGPAMAEHFLQSPPIPPVLPAEIQFATVGDAQGLSTFSLTWLGERNLRYVVYRVGEDELIDYLNGQGIDTSIYVESEDDVSRATSLEILAARVEARGAFQPRSGLIPLPPEDDRDKPGAKPPMEWPPVASENQRFDDTLQGSLNRLTVYTVLARSRGGILSDWPDRREGFVVVAVAKAPQPSTPVIARIQSIPNLQDDLVGGNTTEVSLSILEQASGTSPIGSFEIYRTTRRERANNVRHMRLVGKVSELSFEPSDPNIPQDPRRLTWIDKSARPWKDTYYRVVARALVPTQNRAGMRSNQSSLISVVPVASGKPNPPKNVVFSQTAGTTKVSFQSDASSSAAGDFRFTFLQVLAGETNELGTFESNEIRIGNSSSFGLDETHTEIQSITPQSIVRIRVTDPIGRSVLSDPIRVMPLPDLVDLEVKSLAGSSEISFLSSSPVVAPTDGSWKIEIFLSRRLPNGVMVTNFVFEAPLHEIGTNQVPSQLARSETPNEAGLFTYRMTSIISVFDVVVVRLTNPIGEHTELNHDQDAF